MKKMLIALEISLLSLGILSGCSSDKDPVIAQVGSEKICQSDLEFLQRTVEHPFGEPGQEKAALGNLIENARLFQASQKLLGGRAGKIDSGMDAFRDRFLTRAYEDFYVAENYGHTDEELEKYFASNRKLFADSACRKVSDCRERVAQELYRTENADSLERFIQANAKMFDRPASVEIVYLESADPVAIDRANRDLSAGRSPDSIPGAKRISLSADNLSGLFKNDSVRGALFGEKKAEVGSVRTVGKLLSAENGLSVSLVFKVLSRHSAETASSEKILPELRRRFAYAYKDYMANYGDSLRREQYKFRMTAVDYPEVKKYYAEHPSEFAGVSLDSAKDGILRKLENGKELSLDPDYVLATLDGKPFIRERDVSKVLAEIPANLRIRYPRAKRVLMLASWKLSAMEARRVGLENSRLMEKIEKDARVSFYRKAFADSLAHGGFFVPRDSLRKIYAKVGAALFPNTPFERVVGYLGIYATTPENAFRYEFYRNAKRYAGISDVDSAKTAVFKNKMQDFSRDWFERYKRQLAAEYPVQVNDSAYLPLEEFSSSAIVARADSLYNARQPELAKRNWNLVIALFPDDDSLFSRAVYKMATIDNEMEHFPDADAEYAAFYAMWPASADAEKALFSRAFLLHENLKQDSTALGLFLEFQKKYPKSELSESVDWLSRDIRSGGKLSAELLEKISKQDVEAK